MSETCPVCNEPTESFYIDEPPKSPVTVTCCTACDWRVENVG